MINELEIRRLGNELEHSIREINRAKIADLVGGVSKSGILDVADTVSCLRARYLKKVLELRNQFGDDSLSPETIADLRQLRESYDEALQGFDALHHALQRGYFDLDG